MSYVFGQICGICVVLKAKVAFISFQIIQTMQVFESQMPFSPDEFSLLRRYFLVLASKIEAVLKDVIACDDVAAPVDFIEIGMRGNFADL